MEYEKENYFFVLQYLEILQGSLFVLGTCNEVQVSNRAIRLE